MQRALPWFVVLVALMAGFAGFWFGQRRTAALPPPPASAEAVIGQPLPSLDLVDLKQLPYSLDQFRGKHVVLNFWATWCPPCLDELPLLNQLAKDRPDIQIIGIAIDTPEAVSEFLVDREMAYPIVFPREPMSDPSRNLGNYLAALPFSVLVDAEGRIVRTKLGELKPDQVEAFLQP